MIELQKEHYAVLGAVVGSKILGYEKNPSFEDIWKLLEPTGLSKLTIHKAIVELTDIEEILKDDITIKGDSARSVTRYFLSKKTLDALNG